jgi:trehalose-6-phosphate synthase
MPDKNVKISEDTHSALRKKADERNEKIGKMVDRVLRNWVGLKKVKA